MTNELTYRLIEALRDVTDALEELLTHEYEGALHYPDMQRRFDRDMATVRAARAALAEAARLQAQ